MATPRVEVHLNFYLKLYRNSISQTLAVVTLSLSHIRLRPPHTASTTRFTPYIYLRTLLIAIVPSNTRTNLGIGGPLANTPPVWSFTPYCFARRKRIEKEDGILYEYSRGMKIAPTYATSLLSKFMQNPSQIHYGAAKRILRYFQGTIDYGIWYKPTTDPRLFGHTDSDWAGSMDDMKSTSG
ncbi:unnamed protein product [Prunus armeniaca]